MAGAGRPTNRSTPASQGAGYGSGRQEGLQQAVGRQGSRPLRSHVDSAGPSSEASWEALLACKQRWQQRLTATGGLGHGRALGHDRGGPVPDAAAGRAATEWELPADHAFGGCSRRPILGDSAAQQSRICSSAGLADGLAAVRPARR